MRFLNKKLFFSFAINFIILTISPLFLFPQILAVDLPDIDVTYIERIPRYYHYNVVYNNGIPSLAPFPDDPDQNPNNDKHWPSPGEQVSFIAHIINKGNTDTGLFTYRWFIDNSQVKSGTHQSLAPNEEATESFSWQWPANLNDHTVKFTADPENTIHESAENNNELIEYTNSLSYKIWVETGIYNIFNQTLNGFGTYSFEDWIQWQLSAMKSTFTSSVYPASPQGVKDRIRIDKIQVGSQLDTSGDGQGNCSPLSPMKNDPDQYTIDGRWQFVDGDCTNIKGQNGQYQNYVNEYAGKIDWGLVHELAHQLGIIDLYRMNIASDPDNHYRFYVTDLNGQLIDPLPLLPIFPRDGIMGGGDIRPHNGNYFESHTVGGMNSNYLYRRGSYGDYLYDTPDNNYLKFLDYSGNPLVGAEIKIFQKEADTEIFDNNPEITGTTDNEGKIFLTNRPAPSVTTVTGHQQKNNPFGKIDVVATNGTMFIKIAKSGQEDYAWFTITELNLAYWEGNTQMATYTISTDITGSILSPSPTSSPTPSPSPIPTPTEPPNCPRGSLGNLDCSSNGIIDVYDLNLLLTSWGIAQGSADLDNNGQVDATDLNILLSNWGSP